MQRLSLGSPGVKPRLDAAAAAEEADEKAGKPLRPAPDKSIHLIPLLTVLCFLVLFLFSRGPASSSLADSPPLLAIAARSLEVTADTAASVGRGSGVYRRLKANPRLGMARQRR